MFNQKSMFNLKKKKKKSTRKVTAENKDKKDFAKRKRALIRAYGPQAEKAVTKLAGLYRRYT
jgi:hypothetical protein